MAPVSPAAAIPAEDGIEEAAPLPSDDANQGCNRQDAQAMEVVELSDDDETSAAPAPVHSDRLALLKQQLELLKLATNQIHACLTSAWILILMVTHTLQP